jgi:hypothetical protein
MQRISGQRNRRLDGLHWAHKYRITNEETQEQSWWSTVKNYNLFGPLSILRPKGPGTSNALRRNLSLLY